MITRENLLDGSLRRRIMAADPTMVVLSDEERAASLKETFGDRLGREDIWVFGYGSLIWNPAIRFVERRLAQVVGWHRQFCLWTPIGRGTPERPGLMLALERGGSCRGVAFRIAAAEAPFELDLLWRREMLSGAYHAKRVRAATPEGRIEAVTFVINRQHPRYAGTQSEACVVEALAHAAGVVGRCCDYLFNTVEHLDELGIRDERLHRLCNLVRARHACADAP